LSVADNARDAVLLHVSAASERQARGNETGAMTKKKVHHTLTQSDAMTPLSYSFSHYSI